MDETSDACSQRYSRNLRGPTWIKSSRFGGSVALTFQTENPLFRATLKNGYSVTLDLKRMRFPLDIIAVCIRWYAAYPLSYRHLEEMMQERGVVVDHSSINRWAIRFLPLLEKTFRTYK